ncbi:hypothetical protein GGR22_000376 [Flavobacterium gossypii]|uniref:Uncharacterized protein n=1 Tax=Flavobacterium gossypii TaxID=1646119 RepID=A0ABR6DKQ5_9FLAO|nr:hypothetical protein [Flavobacterium gossypii]
MKNKKQGDNELLIAENLYTLISTKLFFANNLLRNS